MNELNPFHRRSLPRARQVQRTLSLCASLHGGTVDGRLKRMVCIALACFVRSFVCVCVCVLEDEIVRLTPRSKGMLKEGGEGGRHVTYCCGVRPIAIKMLAAAIWLILFMLKLMLKLNSNTRDNFHEIA